MSSKIDFYLTITLNLSILFQIKNRSGIISNGKISAAIQKIPADQKCGRQVLLIV